MRVLDYVGRDRTTIKPWELRHIRKATRIIARLAAQCDTTELARPYNDIGHALDSIILDHTVGGRPPRVEPN